MGVCVQFVSHPLYTGELGASQGMRCKSIQRMLLLGSSGWLSLHSQQSNQLG
jgi:hypothetical protein